LLSLTTAGTDPGTNSNRGYLYNASNILAATIIAGVLPDGYPLITTNMNIATDFLLVSHGVEAGNISGGLADRVRTDSDSTTRWYQDYVTNNRGNDARVMLMPVNSGHCGGTVFTSQNPAVASTYAGANTCIFPVGDGTTSTKPAVPSYTVIGWGRFFLREATYYDGISGNRGVCAEYIGPGLVEGGGQPAGTNIYAVKLIQ